MNTTSFLTLCGISLLFAATPAVADQVLLGDAQDGDIYEASIKAITILLVIAVLVESALEVIFNWRVFRAYFSVSGVKTLINIGVSLFIVIGFKVDVMSSLLNIYKPGENFDPTFGTQLLTALIIAGGSSGVNNLLGAFGYRNNTASEDEAPRPPPDKAWIAVRVQRKDARSAVQVHITEEPRPPAGLTSIAGTCLSGRPGLLSLLMRNNDRFPQNGGYPVEPDTAFHISVSAKGNDGKTITRQVTDQPVKLARGAIVDFDVEV